MATLSLRPTVVIGFGTSGARVADGIQRRMYEVLGISSLPIFQFLAIETNSQYTRQGPPRSDATAQESYHLLRLSTGGQGDFWDFSELLAQFDRQQVRYSHWVDHEVARKLSRQGEGASNLRLKGRLLLWANMEEVYNAISHAVAEAKSDEASEGTRRVLSELLPGQEFSIDHRPMIIVCGTATGGSFSGAALDLGYICQDILQVTHPDEWVYAIVMLPPRQSESQRKNLPMFKANTYGLLVESEYYTRMDEPYVETWPGLRKNVRFEVPPYGYTYYVSQEYREGDAIRTIDGLREVVSLKVFCDLMGLHGQRVRGLTDFFGHGRPRNFTFGLGAIVHPRYQLSELAACEAGIQLCDRWLNPKQFEDVANRTRSVPEPDYLSGKAQRAIEGSQKNGTSGFLTDIFQGLGARGGDLDSLYDKVKGDVEKLKDGQINLAVQFIEPGNTYYGIIRNTLTHAEERIVKRVSTVLRNELDLTQNLPYVIVYAAALQNAFQRTITLWEAMGVPEEHDAWEQYVQGEVVQQIEVAAQDGRENFLNLLLRRTDLCQAMTLEAIDALKLHLLMPVLRRVSARIEQVKGDFERHARMLERARDILGDRQKQVSDALQDNSLPFARIYAKGTLENDLAELQSRFPRIGAQNIAEAYAPDAKNATNWIAQTLDEWETRDEFMAGSSEVRGLYAAEQLKQAYQQDLLKQASEKLQIEWRRIDYKEKINRFFKRVRKGNLRYDTLGTPLVVKDSTYLIGQDTETSAMLGHVNRILQVKIEERLQLPKMDHMVLYYHDEAFKSVEQLSDFVQLKSSFEDPSETDVDVGSLEIWQKARIAHGVMYKLQNKERAERLRQLFQLVSDFFYVWVQQDQTWQISAVRPRVKHLTIDRELDLDSRSVLPYWRIAIRRRVDKNYKFLTAEGAVNEDVLEEIAADEATSKTMLAQGIEDIKQIGAEGMDALWEKEIKEVVHQRYVSEEEERRRSMYFRASESEGGPGIIQEILSGYWDKIIS